MQDPVVMAFRKRMKHHGYTEIEICKMRPFNGIYLVRAIEPLSHTRVSVQLTLAGMQQHFRF